MNGCIQSYNVVYTNLLYFSKVIYKIEQFLFITIILYININILNNMFILVVINIKITDK